MLQKQTLSPSGARRRLDSAKNLQGLPVGEPNSSHLETSSKRPTHRRPTVGTAKNEGGKLALSQPPLAAPLELPVSGRCSRRDEVKETKRENATTAVLFAWVLPKHLPCGAMLCSNSVGEETIIQALR